MKLKSIFLSILLLGSAAPALAQWQRTPTPNDTLQSVRRLADGSVVFSIYAPKARTVTLGGEIVPFMSENKPVVTENPNGVWNITLKDVEEGVYLLHAAPLSLGGAEGAPCRATLIRPET